MIQVEKASHTIAWNQNKKESLKGVVYSLLLVWGYSNRLYTTPPVAMNNRIQQSAVTDGAHNYGKGTHLYAW